MAEDKKPHEKITDKNNGLSDTQEVLYPDDFKKADEADEQQREEQKKQDEK
ncbi:YfhE family protein [Planococcus lenghuensis]|uniref:YfhE family protein n=1 Tax=Planococcus lenghuensis TaxID=2213202 RepID=A0A1Q2KV19_9BACL|nr:YfhE family protein [Planococcus lenghuensis]AQQ51964.1 YfhE family protein [Planococcus lenghuensis]